MIVYIATDKTNGKSYVGATTMKFKLRQGMHHRTAKKSHYAFHQALRDRPDAFEWRVLAECETKEQMNLVEQEAIDKFKTHIKHGGYNMTVGGVGMFGDSMPAEAHQRGNETRRGAKRTPEMRARMSAASTSRVIPTDAYDAIIAMRVEGKSFTVIGKVYGCSEAGVRGYLRRRAA